MNDLPSAITAEKRALQARRLRQDPQVQALLMAEPLAIIGMGCRFPGGADGADAFWRLLLDKGDAIGPAPAGRWFAEAERPLGGYVDGLEGFDTGYFGLSAHEAAWIDPQQRLLLEVAMDALDDAGLTRAALAGSRTGVFVGACVSDYVRRSLAPGQGPDPYAVSGIADAILANRLSYMLDLNGPSLAVDTACSSALTAFHMACQSLRTGESDMAIVGGVNAILSPEIGRSLGLAGMLAPDGRCKSFDAAADGFTRGEGAGAVILRRLADAMAAGDRIHAVLRGTAINQDGRSNGLTAPNPLAQERVIRAALDNAGIAPQAVHFVETHGTGTALGDPIEVQALSAVYGAPGRAAPLRIGAVKASIGHLEGAAGMAGLIKAVLCLKHGRIPGQVHFTRPNPNFGPGFDLHVPLAAEPWPAPADGSRRFAGVSAFGFGGTNVHLVLEETPPSLARPVPVPFAGDALLVLTAADPAALCTRAVQAADMLAAGADLAGLQATLARRSSPLAYRLAVTGDGPDAVADRLRAAADGATGPDIAVGTAGRDAAGPVFVFTGQGGQWAGMGRGLLGLPAFRAGLDSCDLALRRAEGWSLIEALEQGRNLTPTERAQPVLVAVQVALAGLLTSLGLTPAAIIGHSVGEVAAAMVAGALDIEQGIAIAAARGRLMAELAGRGRMVAVDLAPDAVAPALAGLEVDIAAINGPASLVLSGTPEGVEAAIARLNVPARPLPGSYAFHGRQVAGAADALATALAGLVPAVPGVAMISTVTGGPAPRLDGAYWGRNAREPVDFAAASAHLLAAGHRRFVEIGPHPALLSGVAKLWAARGGEAGDLALVPTLRRATDDRLSLLRSVGDLFVRGFAPDWDALCIKAGRVTPLPPYPWQRRPCWLPEPATTAPVAAEPGEAALHAVEFTDAPAAAAPAPGTWAVRGAGALHDALADRLGTGGDRQLLVLHGVGDDAAAAVDACDHCLQAVRGTQAPLWLVTGDPQVDPVAGALWSLVEGIGWELPGRIAGVIGVGGDVAPDRLVEELGRSAGRVVLAGDRRLAPVLRRLDGAAGMPTIDPAASYLVTGGLGGIGLACAGWLADAGALHLVLAGRRAPTDDALTVLEGLRRRGVVVEVASVDMADAAAVARLLDGFGRERPVLCGVIHAAGVLRDSLLRGQDRDALSDIFAAKAGGADLLDRLTRDHRLDFLLFMSSMAGLFGALGQAGYGAANGFLDALARRRRAGGQVAASVAWGPWLEAGMAARLGDDGAAGRRARGIGALSNAQALSMLGPVLAGATAPVTAALRLDWPTFRAALPDGAGPLAASLLAPPATTPKASPPAPGALAALSALPPLARRGRLRLLVGEALAAVMGGGSPDPNRGFFDQGMDSLMAMALQARLNQALGGIVGPTAVFEHATVTALADHLLSRLPGNAPPATAAAPVRQSGTLSDLLAELDAAAGPQTAERGRG
ncbi:type I polyketide synthase [Niveispirillum sp. KHB5.9]|uniref:type I polyketide synthase n=1 Tax=Niveispirillum sp. KHB5.9 TaxID=3400269 RepID=UPI003A8AEF76